MPNRTFYFTETNLHNLTSEPNTNGTLNLIVAAYYAGRTKISANETVANPDKKQRFDELKKQFPQIGEYETVVEPEHTA